MAKEVAAAKSTELATYDYGSDGGAGFENQTSSDYSIPFITVLQQMSPQVKDPDDGGIEGARPGMILNTVTGEIFTGKDGIEFIPALTQHTFVEWVPKDAGGGFVAVHQIDSPVVAQAKANSKEFGKLKLANGNELVETFYVYGVVSHDGIEEMAVIAFTSTKIKVYKKFSTTINMFTVRLPDGRKQKPPLYAHSLKITTTKEKNTKGDFFNFSISPANGNVANSLLSPSDPRFQAAKDCYDMVKGGTARASYETQDTTGGDTTGGFKSDLNSNDAPF